MESIDISGSFSDIDSEQKYRCDECTYETNKRSNLMRHLKKHIQDQDPNCTSTPLKPIDAKCLMCDQCAKSFRSKFGLKLHVLNKHQLTFKHICKFCEKGFNQTIQYRFHLANHVDVPLDSCSKCGKRFKAAGSLKRHSCTETPQKHECDECGAVLGSSANLSYHKKGLHKTPSYKCDVCGRWYKWRSSLKVHKKRAHYSDCPATSTSNA